MARVTIVGDGPGGLSAALFLAKNGHDTVVVGEDGTPMHYAHLHNYLGVPDQPGPEFQERARGQVREVGADLRTGHVTGISADGDTFTVTLEDGDSVTSDYLVLAAGKKGGDLARSVGVQVEGDGVEVDTQYRTGVDRVYAVGRIARPTRSQAIISAGAGAVAALDIMAREEGKDVTDWDTPDDD